MTARQWRLAVAAELVLGMVLGSLFLGTHSLFLDESVSSTLATAPWHFFANTVSHREANMALYYLVLRGWVVFGHGGIALRSLSVIFAVGALWVVILLRVRCSAGASHFSPGCCSRSIRSTSRFRAQDVRELAGASPRERVLLLLCPGHPPGGPTQQVLLDGLHRSHGPRRLQQLLGRARPGRAGAVAGVPPLRADPVAPLTGVRPSRGCPPGPARLVDRGDRQCGCRLGWPVPRPSACSPTSACLFPIRCSTRSCSLRFSRSLRTVLWALRRPAIGAVFDRQWPLLFTLCWLVVPVAFVVMLSLVDRPLLVIRYLMVSLPAAILLVAFVIDRVASLARRGAPVIATVLLVIVLGASAVGAAQRTPRSGPAFPVVRGLHRRPGSARLRHPLPLPLRAYTRRVVHGREAGRRTRPHPVYPATAWGVNPLYFDGDVPFDPAAIERAASRYERIWVVSATADLFLYPGQATAMNAALRRAGFAPAGTTHFRGVEVTEELKQ